MICKYTLPTPLISPAKQVSTAGAADFYLVFAKFGAEVLKLVNLLIVKPTRLFPMVYARCNKRLSLESECMPQTRPAPMLMPFRVSTSETRCGHFYGQSIDRIGCF